MSDNRVPQFCKICGSRLIASDTTVGFDPFTGERELTQSLHCPNPTVEITGGFNKRTAQTYHPSWSNSEGVWQQQ